MDEGNLSSGGGGEPSAPSAPAPSTPAPSAPEPTVTPSPRVGDVFGSAYQDLQLEDEPDPNALLPEEGGESVTEPPVEEPAVTDVPPEGGEPVTEPPAEAPPAETEPAGPSIEDRVAAMGGVESLDIVAPLLEGFDLSTEAGAARAHEVGVDVITRLGEFDRSAVVPLLYGVYDQHKDTLAAWLDQERGITPELLEGYQAWRQDPQGYGRQADAFPAPDHEQQVSLPPGLIPEFPEGTDLDLTDSRDKALYDSLKYKHEKESADRRADAERQTREAQTAQAEERRASDQRFQEYQTRQVKAITDACESFQIPELIELGKTMPEFKALHDALPEAAIGSILNDRTMSELTKRAELAHRQGGKRAAQLEVEWRARMNEAFSRVAAMWTPVAKRMTAILKQGGGVERGPDVRLPQGTTTITLPERQGDRPRSVREVFDPKEAERFLQVP